MTSWLGCVFFSDGDCGWSIQSASLDYVVHVTFVYVSIPTSSDCLYSGNVQVYDGKPFCFQFHISVSVSTMLCEFRFFLTKFCWFIENIVAQAPPRYQTDWHQSVGMNQGKNSTVTVGHCSSSFTEATPREVSTCPMKVSFGRRRRHTQVSLSDDHWKTQPQSHLQPLAHSLLYSKLLSMSHPHYQALTADYIV